MAFGTVMAIILQILGVVTVVICVIAVWRAQKYIKSRKDKR